MATMTAQDAIALARKYPVKIKNPTDSLGYLLWQVQHNWQRQYEQKLRKINLTHLQVALLASTHTLHGQGEIPTQVRLATFTKFDPMMVSKALGLLERKGYLKRIKRPPSKLIALTDAGGKALQRALIIKKKSLDKVFGPLGADQERLIKILRSLLDQPSA